MAKKDLKEYRIWKAMKSRCYSPSNKKTGNYQKNNITVCKEWINNFPKFLEDMGKVPEGKYSLDRIDNSKGYYKENCRWVLSDIQSKNRGNFNKLFTYNNETKVLKDWARYFKIPYTTLYLRIYRSNLSFEEAVKEKPFKLTSIEYKGEVKTVVEWSKIFNIPYGDLFNRIFKHKWDIERALTTPFVKRSKIIEYEN